MINLLPQEEKESIKKRMKAKIVTILWFLVFFFCLVFTLVLYSIQFYIRGQEDYQRIILSSAEQALDKTGVNDFKKQINESNALLKRINNFYKDRFLLTDVLAKVFSALPSGIRIINLNTDFSQEDGFKFNISGFSPTREILFDFRKNVEEAGFKDINFPADNWVKSDNIDFYISFSIPKK